MKHHSKIGIVAVILVCLSLSCKQKESLSISNKLTTFIPEEKILVENSTRKMIASSSGNFLRDAIRMIHTDERTEGYYKNISLVNTAISDTGCSYTFSGVTSSTIDDYRVNSTQRIVVTIEKEEEELFYELSFGSKP